MREPVRRVPFGPMLLSVMDESRERIAHTCTGKPLQA
jgi:hypothetical protein